MTSVRAGGSMLELVGIHRSFSTGPVTVDVLHGVDLCVDSGDLVAIMGPSGSGKSTLMNIIGLLDWPDHGRYILKGREIASMTDDELAMLRNVTIGFVFQSFHLLPRLNAWQNVGLPLVYRGIDPKSIRRRAVEMLDRVGLESRSAHRPDELSGGQRQRVAIARALVGNPEILLADEPTGALDAETGQATMKLLKDLHASEGMTAIVITHDRDIALQCPRRFRISGGLLETQPPMPDSTAGPAGDPPMPDIA